jgi:DNA-binding transcriptional ArsR family regulator
MLEDLVISKVRVKLLCLFFSNLPEMYHVRDLVRRTGEEINAVRRELANLEKAGLLKKEPRGNRLYYWVNSGYPLLGEILAIVAKESGLGEEIIKNKNRLGKISYAVFSSQFVRRTERRPDEVDILIVGNIVLAELSALIKKEEERRGQEINYTAMTNEEFEFRRKRRDPFLLGILNDSKVMVVGDEVELVG